MNWFEGQRKCKEEEMADLGEQKGFLFLGEG